MDNEDDIIDSYHNLFNKVERQKQLSRISFIEKRLQCLEKIVFWLSIPIVGYLLGLTINFFINHKFFN